MSVKGSLLNLFLQARTGFRPMPGLYAQLPFAPMPAPATCSQRPACLASNSRHFGSPSSGSATPSVATSSLTSAQNEPAPTAAPAKEQASALQRAQSLPDDLKREVPRVIFNPPWTPTGEEGFKRKHARAIMAILQVSHVADSHPMEGFIF